jgi:hypothetical protein
MAQPDDIELTIHLPRSDAKILAASYPIALAGGNEPEQFSRIALKLIRSIAHKLYDDKQAEKF